MICVRESAIQGRGLFAAGFIAEGTIIGRIDGRPTDQDGLYVLWIDGKGGFEVTNDFKYINHSDQPSAVYYDDLTVVALRDIQPNEEITHDYRGGDDVEMHFAHEAEATAAAG